MGDNKQSVDMVEVWRGSIVESVHKGNAVICDSRGNILKSWGCPDHTIYPRSSCKILQALPLIETGASRKLNLDSRHFALACASHSASALHTGIIKNWLSEMNLTSDDLRCGIQPIPRISTLSDPGLKRVKPSQLHNNCSGKHTGFLAVSKHLGCGPEYLDIDHMVQKNIKTVFQEMTDTTSVDYGIDGCSAPNFVCKLQSLATAMAKIASPHELGPVRSNAAILLYEAMKSNPILVAGEGRACTDLILASGSSIVVKTGAEGVFTAIIPSLKVGVAVKILDGSTRAAECAITAILCSLGVLDFENKLVKRYLSAKIVNWNGLQTGTILPFDGFWKRDAKIKV